MKEILFLFVVIFVFDTCGPKQDEVERIFKDGVEIVINHLEPYRINGEPSMLHWVLVNPQATPNAGMKSIIISMSRKAAIKSWRFVR